MLIGVYADPHLTKNMRTFQDTWDDTAKKSIYKMYDFFDAISVESAICLGDFFDAPRIEAKHMQLVLPILEHMNKRTYPTYLLLGNHEIDSDDSNILDFLSMYENIIPVTELLEVEGKLFIPYNVDPSEVDMTDKVVFTHHDIYGSELAGGKTKAFFGLDSSIFKKARLVMNGHVHLKSKVAKNIYNAGSLLVSAQGEMKVGTYPSYYTIDLDSMDLDIKAFDNRESMIYLTTHLDDIGKVETTKYDSSRLVLKVEYSGEVPETMIETLHTSYRKLVEDISDKQEEKIKSTNFDLKNYLVDYIKGDIEVSEMDKEEYIQLGMSLLS